MQRALLGRGLCCHGVKLLGRGERLVGTAGQLAFTDHVYQLDAGQGALRGLRSFEAQHGAGDALDRPMILLNGMVTNDKFCLVRRCQVQLRWSRQPYRFRPRKADYLLDETSHREGSHETPLAGTTAIPVNGGRGTALGSGVPIPAALDDASRTVRRALAISRTTDGGDT